MEPCNVYLFRFLHLVLLNFVMYFFVVRMLATYPCRLNYLHLSQQIKDIAPALICCWPTVYEAGPALDQHCAYWVNNPYIIVYDLFKIVIIMVLINDISTNYHTDTFNINQGHFIFQIF